MKRAGRPDLIPILTPSFPPGCKRIAKSENYLEALAKPNVTVVPRAVKDAQNDILIDTEGNTQQVDVLVLATGFNVEGFLGNLESKCLDGFLFLYKDVCDSSFLTLNSLWKR